MSDAIKKVLSAAVSTGQIVGGELIVLKNGKAVFCDAFGFRDRAQAIPMVGGLIYRLASITKSMTSVAVLRTIDLGKLTLEDNVSDYLSDFHPRTADGSAPNISMHHLLTHTAGLSYAFFEPAESRYWTSAISTGLDQPGLSLTENLGRLARAPLRSAPGEAWFYSMATDVLGGVLEAIWKKPLEKILRDLVLDPLVMKDTSFLVSDQSRLTKPYWDGVENPEPMAENGQLVPFAMGIQYSPGRMFDTKSFQSGGAGLNGTATDLAQFYEAMRNGGGGLLRPASMVMFASDQTGGMPNVTLDPGWGFSYGSAVLLDPKAANSPHNVGTLQWGGTWGHHWFVDPVAEIVSVQLTNTAVRGMTGDFPNAVTAAIYKDYA